MRRGLILAVLVALLITQSGVFSVAAAPLFTTQTNSTPLEIDDDVLDNTVIMPAEIIADVNISITFEKIDDAATPACIPLGGAGHNGGDAFNPEISFSLESPLGTVVDLVFDDNSTATYSSYTAYSDVNTVIFDDAAAFQVGGSFPITARLQPEEPLSAFNGEDALGTWTLHSGDNASGDPLCLYEWTLAVNKTLSLGGGGGGGITFSNTTPGEIDNGVNVSSIFVNPGGTILDVSATIRFEKIANHIDDPACTALGGPGHDGSDPFNGEISFRLESPSGTMINLVFDFNAAETYTDDDVYGGVVDVTFDDAAAKLVGGPAPAMGNFRPEEPLSAFDGEDATGLWNLYFGDYADEDPLCLYQWSLTFDFPGGSSAQPEDEGPRCTLKNMPATIYIGADNTFTASGMGRLEDLRFRNVDGGGFSWLVPISVTRNGNSWEATFSNANGYGMTAIEPGVYQVNCFGPGGTSGGAIKVTVLR